MVLKWKDQPLRLTILVSSIVLFFGSLLGVYLSYTSFQKNILVSKAQVQISQRKYQSPKRIVIPSINVNAKVDDVGLTEIGAMGVPEKIEDVGWFSFGVKPGQKGSAVMAGHLNGKSGERGVFADLEKIQAGDRFYVEDETGVASWFVVRKVKEYDPGFASEVFEKDDGIYLNLITCGGEWKKSVKSYSKRLVIFSEKDNI